MKKYKGLGKAARRAVYARAKELYEKDEAPNYGMCHWIALAIRELVEGRDGEASYAKMVEELPEFKAERDRRKKQTYSYWWAQGSRAPRMRAFDRMIAATAPKKKGE